MDKLMKLRQEYGTQDNRMTAYPIFVTVQELVSVGVIADGYSVNCPYGDGETKTERAYNPETDENDGDEVQVGYIWHDVEWFLTIKGAEEYMKANKHNHGKLRTYVHHFEQRNFEMRELLEAIGFKQIDKTAEAAKGRECPNWPEKKWIKGHENTCIIKNETIDQCIEAFEEWRHGTGQAAKVEGAGGSDLNYYVDGNKVTEKEYSEAMISGQCHNLAIVFGNNESPVAAEDWRIVLWRFAHEIKERRDFDLGEFQDWLTEELKTLLSRHPRISEEELFNFYWRWSGGKTPGAEMVNWIKAVAGQFSTPVEREETHGA